MSIPAHAVGTFFKLEAMGNDFVLIDARTRDLQLDPAEIRSLANRRTGIGFDQILILRPGSEGTLARVDIFNSDGSPAEQCGNGMRAIAAWLERVGEFSTGASLDTPAGTVGLARASDGGYIADLPGPELLDPSRLGLPAPALPAGAGAWQLVSVGNPHLLIAWRENPSPTALAEVVAMLASGPWNGRTNVGLMHIESNDAVTLRVHERGAGPTPACGSAACAAALAVRLAHQASAPVAVEQPGGTLVVDLASRAGRAVTSGPATVVFEGRIS